MSESVIDDPLRPASPEDGRSEAEAVAAAVLAVSTVAALSSGPAGQFRSYLPGGRTVPGVRLDADGWQINVIAYFGTRLLEVGDTVVGALGPLAGGHPVRVTIDDIVLPGEDPADQRAGTADSAVQSTSASRSTSASLTDES